MLEKKNSQHQATQQVNQKLKEKKEMSLENLGFRVDQF